MRSPWFSLLATSVALSGAIACGSSESASKPRGSASESGSPPTASATSSARATGAQPSAHPAKLVAADTWLLVSKGVDLAVIELRVGKAPVVELEQDSDDGKALAKKVAELASEDGIELEMHEPGQGGKGRGALSSTLMKPGDRLYPVALRLKLEEGGYTAKEVPAFDDASPPSGIKRLEISREGEEVGSIDFSKSPPVITVMSTKSEGLALSREWESLQKLEKLVIRFHAPKAGVETLYKVEAKPGAADYPNAVRLYLIVNRYYDDQRKYKLVAVP